MASVLQFFVKYLGGAIVEKAAQYLIKTLTDWLVNRAIRNIETRDNTFDKERYYLLKQVRGAKTNEERKILSVTLARLSRYELPNADGGDNSGL